MRWKNMKSLNANSKWYEGIGMESWEGPRVSKYVEKSAKGEIPA
jgi:hypothetical protein